MTLKTIESNAALELARTRGYFCRVSAGGRVLVFYTGKELEPGTWLEAGKTGMTDNGFISRVLSYLGHWSQRIRTLGRWGRDWLAKRAREPIHLSVAQFSGHETEFLFPTPRQKPRLVGNDDGNVGVTHLARKHLLDRNGVFFVHPELGNPPLRTDKAATERPLCATLLLVGRQRSEAEIAQPQHGLHIPQRNDRRVGNRESDRGIA